MNLISVSRVYLIGDKTVVKWFGGALYLNESYWVLWSYFFQFFDS